MGWNWMTSPNRPIVNYPAKVWKSNMTINAKGMRYDSTDNLSFVADQSDKIWPTATEWNWAGTTVAQWELYWKKRSTTIGGFTSSSQLSERNVNVFARFQVLKHQLTAQCCKIWPAMGRGAQDTPPGWAFFGLKTAKMPKSLRTNDILPRHKWPARLYQVSLHLRECWSCRLHQSESVPSLEAAGQLDISPGRKWQGNIVMIVE